MNIREISKPTDDGVDALVGLLHQQMIDIGSEKTERSILSSVQDALKSESRVSFFVLFEQTQPVGMALLNVCSGVESEGDYIWLNEIHIAKAYRGKNLGKYLLEHIVKWARMNGCKRILGVTACKNAAAHNLFRSKGFQVSDMKWIDLGV